MNNEAIIRLLDDRDHVRLRKNMYIPNIDYSIYEVLDNAVDQFMAGYGTEIDVLIEEDGSAMIADRGQGLPIAESQDIPGMSQAELALSRLKAGGKFDDNGVKSAGLHGLGSSAINFLSEYFSARIAKNKKLYGLDFIQGIITDDHLYELEWTDEYPENGTIIFLKPDSEIWTNEEDG